MKNQGGLLGCLLVSQHIASFGGACSIDGVFADIDELNDSFLVDDKRRPVTKSLFFIKDAVVFNDCALEVTEERESYG